MKDLGWYLFLSLFLADIIAIIMIKLGIKLGAVIAIGAIVFIVLSAVMYFGDRARKRAEKREAEANAKIAELQEQVDGSQKQR